MDGERIYYLNAHGRERVNATVIKKKTNHALHTVLANDVYMFMRYPSTWKAEVKITVPDVCSIIADAVFKRNGIYHIVEIDRMQTMKENKRKIDIYRQIVSLDVFERPPVFIWLTGTDYRQKELKRLLHGLQCEVYQYNDVRG